MDIFIHVLVRLIHLIELCDVCVCQMVVKVAKVFFLIFLISFRSRTPPMLIEYGVSTGRREGGGCEREEQC